MGQSNAKETAPLQNLFVDVKKIIDFMVVKDMAAANAAETDETKYHAQGWMDAVMKRDTYKTYRRLWTRDMFQEVVSSVSQKEFEYYAHNPDRVPLKFRDTLRTLGRKAYLERYIEKNNYYRMLLGVPDYEDYDWIYLSEELQEKYGVDSETPVHLMDTSIQRKYMTTDEYAQVVADNPDKKYLRYMGIYKVDLYTARNAKDFEIIRYPNNRADINPHLLSVFSDLYDKYREYVMVVLYNPQFENVFDYYRTFMGALILEYTLFQLGNSSLEAVNNRKYLDDTMLHTASSMYGIPDSLLMNRNARRDLAIHILNLVKEKGTKQAYYDLVKILGYEDVTISKLMLMKGQKFDDTGKAIYQDGKPVVEPYFLQVDLNDEDPYTSIANGKCQQFPYEEITNGDPTWWNTPDVEKALKESDYSMIDTKYITIDATIHQMEYMFESIYFARMVLDNRDPIENFTIEIPELFGTEQISVYDIILFMISAMCKRTNSDGKFITDTDLKAIAGFNFDLNMNTFLDYIFNSKYIDTDRIMEFINALTITNIDDVSRVFNDVISPMREWLERKIVQAEDRQEYLEYESVYQALFSYDILKSSSIGEKDFKSPMTKICEEFGITEEQMTVYRHFYPRTLDGKVITVNEIYDDGRYRECYDFIDNKINWYIDIPSLHATKGYLYMHDILNCHDCRDIPVRNERGIDTGLKYFMEYIDENGWQVDTQVVEAVLQAIDELDSTQLNGASIMVSTPNIDDPKHTVWYYPGTPLVKISPVFKNILKRKIEMDLDGMAEPADSYFELLRRNSPSLYALLMNDGNLDTWANNASIVITALENELSFHMKYIEQAVIGKDLFFKPLITLINIFKSMMVYIAKTGVKYIFDSKMDITGTSNMFRLFDEVTMLLHFTTVSNSGFTSEFGMYDTIPKTKRRIILKDQTRLIKETIGQGFAVKTRTSNDGSMRMVDEAKFYKNGTPLDPNDHSSLWFTGEPGTGRWSEDDDILMRTRTGTERIKGIKTDYDGWKEYVEP